MKNSKYTKSFLLFWHIILAYGLTFFTVTWSFNFSKNLFVGYIFSAIILLIYFFILYKSATLFNKGSVGASYFLTISGFIALAFSEMLNCSNSL